MTDSAPERTDFTRRDFFVSLAAATAAASSAGLASAESAAPTASAASVTAASIAEAEKLAGIAFTDAERAQIAKTVGEHLETFKARAAFGPLDNQLAPAQVFRALLPGEEPRVRSSAVMARSQRKGKAEPEGDAE